MKYAAPSSLLRPASLRYLALVLAKRCRSSCLRRIMEVFMIDLKSMLTDDSDLRPDKRSSGHTLSTP